MICGGVVGLWDRGLYEVMYCSMGPQSGVSNEHVDVVLSNSGARNVATQLTQHAAFLLQQSLHDTAHLEQERRLAVCVTAPRRKIPRHVT